MKPKAAISWSGGKDSCAALMRVGGDLDVVSMITMFDENGWRSRSHGLRPEVLAAQAGRLGLRHIAARCTWESYDAAFGRALGELPGDVTHVVFGDILFDEHRRWAERMCADHRLVAVEPLFGSSTAALFTDWLNTGGRAVIVAAQSQFLDSGWLGRTLTAEMLPEFERLGVDPCGERGEYHTVVSDCALFRGALDLRPGQIVQRSGCWAMDLTVAGRRPTA